MKLSWTLLFSEAQRVTYLMTSFDDLLVLYALDLDIHRNPKSTNLFRLSELDARMDYGVFHCAALSQATSHHLQRAKEARCHPCRP